MPNTNRRVRNTLVITGCLAVLGASALLAPVSKPGPTAGPGGDTAATTSHSQAEPTSSSEPRPHPSGETTDPSVAEETNTEEFPEGDEKVLNLAILQSELVDQYREEPGYAGVTMDVDEMSLTLHWADGDAPSSATVSSGLSTADPDMLVGAAQNPDEPIIRVEDAPYSYDEIQSAIDNFIAMVVDKHHLVLMPAEDGAGIEVRFSPETMWASMTLSQITA